MLKTLEEDMVDHWGDILVKPFFQWQDLQNVPNLIDGQGKKMVKGLYPFVGVWTNGISDQISTRAVGGPSMLLSVEGEEMALQCNLSEGAHYDCKLYVGPSNFHKHYRLHHRRYMGKCSFKATGKHSLVKIGVGTLEVGLRQDGHIQYKGKVYKDPEHLSQNKPETPQKSRLIKMLLNG